MELRPVQERTLHAAPAEDTASRGGASSAQAYLDDGHWREGRINFPVRVGVTGHRDVDDWETLRTAVREHLGAVRQSFPNTDTVRVRFTVLSALAEGADRLVVDEAFGLLGEDNVELHVVLPLDREDYLQDFQTPESRSEFDALLSKATSCTQTTAAEDRNEAYERGGRWIVDHSDVLIAVWDGRQPSGRGGTAEIVHYARFRGKPVLVVPAMRTSQPRRTPREVSWRTDLRARLASARQAYERIEEFNRGSINEEPLADQIVRLARPLEEAADGSAIHWLYVNAAEWALPRLARADRLAVQNQHMYYRFGEAVYASAALALTAVAAQSEASVSPLWALVEVAFMLAVIVMLWTGRRARFHDRWIGYRSLAEAFRSALFIHLTGNEVRREPATGEPRVTQALWYQRAFTEAWEHRPIVEQPAADPVDLRRFLVDGWIDDQVRYHRKAVARFRRERRRLTRIMIMLFSATFVIGILHSFGIVEGDVWARLFVFLAIALPGFGAALTGIRDQRQYRLHEDRSERTADRLHVLRRNLELQSNLESVQKLAGQVQTVIETENLDWCGVMEFQDLEMVI